jgi:hypothetical protein
MFYKSDSQYLLLLLALTVRYIFQLLLSTEPVQCKSTFSPGAADASSQHCKLSNRAVDLQCAVGC